MNIKVKLANKLKETELSNYVIQMNLKKGKETLLRYIKNDTMSLSEFKRAYDQLEELEQRYQQNQEKRKYRDENRLQGVVKALGVNQNEKYMPDLDDTTNLALPRDRRNQSKKKIKM